jgi:hypothetical protein
VKPLEGGPGRCTLSWEFPAPYSLSSMSLSRFAESSAPDLLLSRMFNRASFVLKAPV